jgi:hypothetical protein
VLFALGVAHAQSLKTMSVGSMQVIYIEPFFVRPALTFSAAFSASMPDRVQISFATGRGGY